MSLAIAGTVRIPVENIEALKPHMQAMIAATRAEDGCETYSFALDVAEAGLLRIYEVWRDRPALDAHARSAHMVTWRAAGASHGVSDRALVIYEIANPTPL